MRFPDRSSEGDSAICSVRPSATKANSNTPREIVASQAGYEWSQQCFSQRDWIAARGSIHIRLGQGGHSPFLRPQKFCVPFGHANTLTYTRHHGSPRYQPTNAPSSTTILQQKPFLRFTQSQIRLEHSSGMIRDILYVLRAERDRSHTKATIRHFLNPDTPAAPSER